MQIKSFLTSLLYFCLGFFSVQAQNFDLQEIKVKEFGPEAFVNFKDIMEDHDVFLIGEDFEKELKSDAFHFNLIQFLNKEEGVNGFLMERGLAEMFFINKYINGGSVKWLEMQENHFRERDIKFFNKLRAYNDSLEKNKIQIMGLGIDAYPEMEILYLDEILQKVQKSNNRIENLHSAAYQVYSKYNLTEQLLKYNEFSSINILEQDYNSILNKTIVLDINQLTNDKEVKQDFLSFIKYRKERIDIIPDNEKQSSPINYSNAKTVALDLLDYHKQSNKEMKFYAHLPWCNLDRENNQRNCDVYAYGALIGAKSKYKVFSVLSLQVFPFSLEKRMVQFNTQINKAANNNYNYSGFQASKDSLINYVILTKSTVSKTRKTLFIEEINNPNYISFYLNYGIIGYVNNDVEALNAAIKNKFPGFSEFKTELGHRFIDLAIDKSGYVIKLSHKWTNEDPVLLTNQESVQFNQKSTTAYLGYNVFRHKRTMVAPMIGIGYANSTLEYMNTDPNANPVNPIFDQSETINYYNPGLILDYMIDINIVSKAYVGIGFNIGYVHDLSNHSWILDGSPDGSTPKLSNSGFHAGFSALINLNKNI